MVHGDSDDDWKRKAATRLEPSCQVDCRPLHELTHCRAFAEHSASENVCRTLAGQTKKSINEESCQSHAILPANFLRNPPCQEAIFRYFRTRLEHEAEQSRPSYPTLALEKGLDTLELFASEPAGLTKSYFSNAQSLRDWRESKCLRLSIKQSVVYCSRPQITHCQ